MFFYFNCCLNVQPVKRFCRALDKQAIEEEGGNPDEIIVAPELTTKKANVTPKRAARGKVCSKLLKQHVFRLLLCPRGFCKAGGT